MKAPSNSRRFLPRRAEVGGAEYRRTEVAGAQRNEQRVSIARIDDRVLHDVPEKRRATQREPVAP